MVDRSLPVINPLLTSQAVGGEYYNRSVATVNNHEIRMSVMTRQFAWHYHPDSDETFLGVAGDLVIEFVDHSIILSPGELITVPAGTLHRTRPNGERSVNLTFERKGANTIFTEQRGSSGQNVSQ